MSASVARIEQLLATGRCLATPEIAQGCPKGWMLSDWLTGMLEEGGCSLICLLIL